MSKIEKDRQADLEARRARLHMQRTNFSERVLPIIFISLGIVTLALIIIAITVLFGIVSWR